jgi:hypothetical protein
MFNYEHIKQQKYFSILFSKKIKRNKNRKNTGSKITRISKGRSHLHN